MSKALTRRFLLTLVVAIALIATSAMCSRHDLGNPLHDQGHCDLCSHLASTAGSPARVTIAGKPVLVVYAVPVAIERPVPTRAKVHRYLPRGPPHSLELI